MSTGDTEVMELQFNWILKICHFSNTLNVEFLVLHEFLLAKAVRTSIPLCK